MPAAAHLSHCAAEDGRPGRHPGNLLRSLELETVCRVVRNAPDIQCLIEVVDQINSELGKRGRLDYDGRPIFGISCIELAEMMMGISKDIEIIPAHI